MNTSQTLDPDEFMISNYYFCHIMFIISIWDPKVLVLINSSKDLKSDEPNNSSQIFQCLDWDPSPMRIIELENFAAQAIDSVH